MSTSTTLEYEAVLTHGKAYTLMSPTIKSSDVIRFKNGMPKAISKATRLHLEKHAVYDQDTIYPDGKIERSKFCAFEFSKLNLNKTPDSDSS